MFCFLCQASAGWGQGDGEVGLLAMEAMTATLANFLVFVHARGLSRSSSEKAICYIRHDFLSINPTRLMRVHLSPLAAPRHHCRCDRFPRAESAHHGEKACLEHRERKITM